MLNDGCLNKNRSENSNFRTSLCLCVFVVCLAAVFSGCGRRANTALGRIREITVVSDRWDWLEPTLSRILQDTIFTPQPEPRFPIRVYNEDQFESYRLLRTLFLIGTNSDTVIRAVLGPRVDSLPQGEYGLFHIPNAWADNQQLVVFVADDESLLISGLGLYAARIRNTFQDVVLGNSIRAVYYRGRDEEKTRSILERYDFGVDVPRGWRLNQEHADSQFVYLFAHFPDRSVFIHWQDSPRPLEPGPLLDLRDSLTRRYYDGDLVERPYTVTDSVEFLAGPALRLQSIWQNDSMSTGGPFVSYCFNHEGRFFMVDGQVFLPGKPKLDQLYQIEAIVRTFAPR